MGDHRADIKIKMEFHGIKDRCDMWINYCGWDGEYDGVDDRIIEFIRSVFERGMAKYNGEKYEYEYEERQKKIEKEEKEELERLQKKYGKKS